MLGVATVATAIVSEILVHSLDAFARAVGLSEFFIAAVIVAIVGNTAEHGGAIVIPRRGKIELASEIAVSSSAQVALLVTPAVALLSFLVTPGAAARVPADRDRRHGRAACSRRLVVRDGRSQALGGRARRRHLPVFAIWGELAVGDLV